MKKIFSLALLCAAMMASSQVYASEIEKLSNGRNRQH